MHKKHTKRSVRLNRIGQKQAQLPMKNSSTSSSGHARLLRTCRPQRLCAQTLLQKLTPIFPSLARTVHAYSSLAGSHSTQKRVAKTWSYQSSPKVTLSRSSRSARTRNKLNHQTVTPRPVSSKSSKNAGLVAPRRMRLP